VYKDGCISATDISRQEHEPPRPIEAESLEASEPAPPDEVAGLRVGCAVLSGLEPDRGAFDELSQELAGDVRINAIAMCFFFPRDSGGELCGLQSRSVEQCFNPWAAPKKRQAAAGHFYKAASVAGLRIGPRSDPLSAMWSLRRLLLGSSEACAAESRTARRLDGFLQGEGRRCLAS
jgi:hypothetical protein